MHPLRRCGHSCAVGAHCQICALESRGKVRRQHDNEDKLRGMMWADNYWLFSDNREKLICMVNDIIEELLDLDVEPKPESLWWTSTHKHQDTQNVRVGSRGRIWGSAIL